MPDNCHAGPNGMDGDVALVMIMNSDYKCLIKVSIR